MDDNTNSGHQNPLAGFDSELVIARMRDRLEKTTGWPEGFELLLKEIFGQGDSFSTDDEEMLSLVVDDFIKGEDIEERYPAFFARLSKYRQVRAAFLEILEMIAATGPELPGLSERPAIKLDFLNVKQPEPLLEYFADGWRATWKITTETLNQLFAPQLGALVRGEDPLDDPWIILIRTDLEVGALPLLVNLEAAQDIEAPDALKLQLSVFKKGSDAAPVQTLKASLTWNTYREIVQIHEKGPTSFPDVPFELITDASTGQLIGDVDLSIQPIR